MNEDRENALIPASLPDPLAVPIRPLPATRAELVHLKDKLEKFISTCARIEADTLAREMGNDTFATLIEERAGLQQLAKGANCLPPEEVASLENSIRAFIARREYHAAEMAALDDLLTRHRTATTALEIDTYAKGVGNYLSHDVRRVIERFREAVNALYAADEELYRSRPNGWDLERIQAYRAWLSSWRDYWAAIRRAVTDLQTAVVLKLGAMEGYRKPDIEIQLDEQESAIVCLLQQMGRRMTTAEILAEFTVRGEIKADSTTKLKLAQLTNRKILNNRRDLKPPGYGFPEWT